MGVRGERVRDGCGARGGAQRLHDEHGAGGMADDALGNAAEHEAVEARAPMRTDHHEICLLLGRDLGDGHGGRARPHDRPRDQAVRTGVLRAALELVLDPVALLLIDRLHAAGRDVRVRRQVDVHVQEQQLGTLRAGQLHRAHQRLLGGFLEIDGDQDATKAHDVLGVGGYS